MYVKFPPSIYLPQRVFEEGKKVSEGLWSSQVVLVVKHPLVNTGGVREADSICESGRPLGGGHLKPIQDP